MIDRFIKGIHKKKELLPKHIALDYNEYKVSGIKIPPEQHFKSKLFKLKDFIDVQVRYGIPVMTVYLLSTNEKDNPHFSSVVEGLSVFFEDLAHEKRIHNNKVKISVLGKWYNLPPKIVDSVKKLSEETREYDRFFLNFCVNYDGQEEIVDACKLIGKRIQAEKMDPDVLSKEAIKENLYSSYFLPPELMIVMNGKKNLSGFLLWDCINASVYFSDKNWSDFSGNDMIKAIAQYQKWKEGK
ncbi:di-trans,poly-cis-decaprenylcistransferase [Candidatus Woesearchaeota archaeon]|nr:di-trans,poly-cis-decaprenylcistransferase [Candidatus Woesearchaeota archaeon]